MFSRSLFSAVALQTLVSTALAGNAIINNHCGYDVTVLYDQSIPIIDSMLTQNTGARSPTLRPLSPLAVLGARA
jgi:hypothetical protein